MRPLHVLLFCLVVLTRRSEAGDLPDGTLLECGAEKVAVLGGTTSPDGHYAFGWTVRPAHDRTPVNWADYDPEAPSTWLMDYLPPLPETGPPPYQFLNGVVDLRAHRFIPVNSPYPYYSHKSHGTLGMAWSHGSQSGRFAVVHNDEPFSTVNLWLIETGGADVQVVDLAKPANKSVRDFLRPRYPKLYDSMEVNYGDVSYGHGEATVDFFAEVPKEQEGIVAKGTVHIALPAGTITGVKAR